MFKHILVPVDGSATAQLAIQKALGLANAFGSCVTAIYVINPYPFTGVGTDFAYGQAPATWRGIIQAAESVQADLIVMGSHGRSGLEKLLLGSVTQAVLTHTHLPVLVVRD